GNGVANTDSAGGGGSGGGILLAADKVVVSGTVSTAGGMPGMSVGGNALAGGAGGLRRIKVLFCTSQMISGVLTGTSTIGALPPLTITSTTHPDPTLIYNDDFQLAAFSWNRPFTVQGYYQLVNGDQYTVPVQGNATLVPSEVNAFAR